MKINVPVMRIAAVLALTAASASAFAQSAEYRRGDRGPHRGWPRVFIEDAEYGARGATCDARRAVRDEMERNHGNVRAGNQLCGDPARGEPKRLRVVYRCGDSEAVRVIARENEVLRLSCRD